MHRAFQPPRRKIKITTKDEPAPAPDPRPEDAPIDYDAVISPDIGPFPWTPAINEEELYDIHRTFVTGEGSERAEEALKAADEARFRISHNAIEATGIEPTIEVLAESISLQTKKGGTDGEEERITGDEYPQNKVDDFFARISTSPELVMEVVKYMDPKSLLKLYCIHKHVNGILNGHLSHCLRICSLHQAPSSAFIYPFTLYANLCIPDPVGRAHPSRPGEVRMVPSLKWLQMVVHREKTVRDILACMARQGHRMPAGMRMSLMKMWLVMDIATSARRVQVMHSEYFDAMDLYHIQMFVVKLDMRFNDPIDGPGEDHLRKLMLGQKGLTPLCRMLKRIEFTDMCEVVRAAVRYDWVVKPEHRLLPMFGIPPKEIGVGHLEGWGKGRIHLLRPDELVVREAVRRKLDLKNHIMGMMLWGYVDSVTGMDTPPTEEEKWMEDDGASERPEHPWKQDLEWLEQEEKVFEESEELKESNDWGYRMMKEAMRAEERKQARMAMKREEERIAEGGV
ncbi:uncharacterized protein RCO7_07911 [Rhynchosporium graminicola]|uniref:F-box domain-containing protein n=1 Tax=Rhynchosporium graminicola TaxID=2792576 RepID=A0A1E1KNK8_9HELO|nr:uncharacterized protein RCO7_07911 [Rhynchosporium commune]